MSVDIPALTGRILEQLEKIVVGKEEQTRLRQEYLEAIRANLRGTLNQISIKEPDGTITNLGKKYGGIKED